jgi:ribonuclease R
MKMAIYSTENIGHFGLQLSHYCHFTSPIRRYVDLMAHRILFGEKDDIEHLEWLTEHTSEKERLSAKAENSVKTLKKIRFAEMQYEKEPKKVYTAVVTKMKPFGLFFDVIDFGLEGFFHISELGQDWWHFDPVQACFIGEKTKSQIRLGTTFSVWIENIDLIHQEVLWKMGKRTA